MKERPVCAMCLLLLTFFGFAERILSLSALDGYYIGYDLSFSTTIINKGPAVIHLTSNRLTDPTMFLFPNDTSQTVRLMTSSHSFKIEADPDGNQIGIFQVERSLQPGQSITIEVSFRAYLQLTATRQLEWTPQLEYSFSGNKQEIPQELVKKYCSSAGPWRIDDPSPSWRSVRELADRLAQNETNVLRAVMLLVAWVGQNIKYPSTRRDRIQLPNETLVYREGDCDEQANLIISMCRTLGIPAYLQSGCVYLPAKADKGSKFDGHLSFELDRIGWHAWAMIYVPPWGWLPVDMTMGYSKEYPILAIQGAATQALSSVTSNNYLVTDYVSETNRDAEELKRTEAYVEEKESIRPIAISPEYQATAGVGATTAMLIAFGIAVVGVYIAVRSRAVAKKKQAQYWGPGKP